MVRVGPNDEYLIQSCIDTLKEMGVQEEKQTIHKGKVLNINLATSRVVEADYKQRTESVALCFSIDEKGKPYIFLVSNMLKHNVTIKCFFNTKDLKAYMKCKFNFETTKYDLNSLGKRVDK